MSDPTQEMQDWQSRRLYIALALVAAIIVALGAYAMWPQSPPAPAPIIVRPVPTMMATGTPALSVPRAYAEPQYSVSNGSITIVNNTTIINTDVCVGYCP